MNQKYFNFRGQHLWLSPERSIFWEEAKALIVSDSHFGKTGHFRKSGIALPQNVFLEDLQRLFNLLQFYKPEQLIVVGDLFHSRSNKEHLLFEKWRNDFTQLEVLLVKGNHDILNEAWYKGCRITVHHDKLCIDEFCFCHDACDNEQEEGKYIFSGHIHPGVKIRGMAKQSLSFPCFYFTEKYCVLPAFSKFTGLALIRPGTGENVFAIVENDLLKLK